MIPGRSHTAYEGDTVDNGLIYRWTQGEVSRVPLESRATYVIRSGRLYTTFLQRSPLSGLLGRRCDRCPHQSLQVELTASKIVCTLSQPKRNVRHDRQIGSLTNWDNLNSSYTQRPLNVLSAACEVKRRCSYKQLDRSCDMRQIIAFPIMR